MARIIKLVDPHDCREEIARDIGGVTKQLALGTIVECSCGNQFTPAHDQRDGAYWAQVPDAERV